MCTFYIFQLLGDILLDRSNTTVMICYVSSKENLIILMNLLRVRNCFLILRTYMQYAAQRNALCVCVHSERWISYVCRSVRIVNLWKYVGTCALICIFYILATRNKARLFNSRHFMSSKYSIKSTIFSIYITLMREVTRHIFASKSVVCRQSRQAT